MNENFPHIFVVTLLAVRKQEYIGGYWKCVYICILYHSFAWNFWTKLHSKWGFWHCRLWHQALGALFWSVLILSRPDHSCRVCFMMLCGEFDSLISCQILLWSLNKDYELDGARLAAGSSTGHDKYLTLNVQFWAPDDGRKNRLTHEECLTEINKLRNVASCWL